MSVLDTLQAECKEIYDAERDKIDGRNKAIDHVYAQETALGIKVAWRGCATCAETTLDPNQESDYVPSPLSTPYNPENNTCLVCGK
jgi:hypothetical protein